MRSTDHKVLIMQSSPATSYPLGTNIFFNTTCSSTLSLCSSFSKSCSYSSQLSAMSFPPYNFVHPPCCSIKLRKCSANRPNPSGVLRHNYTNVVEAAQILVDVFTGLFHVTRFAETWDRSVHVAGALGLNGQHFAGPPIKSNDTKLCEFD